MAEQVYTLFEKLALLAGLALLIASLALAGRWDYEEAKRLERAAQAAGVRHEAR